MINSMICNACGTKTSIQSTVEFVNFACPNCGNLYQTKSGYVTLLKSYTYKPFDVVLPIGLKGIFDNKEYEIICVLVKFLGAFTYAKEYTLVAKDNSYLYLSECNGHWIQLKQVIDIELIKSGKLELNYKGFNYKKYDFYYPDLVRAYGFFDIEIKTFDNAVVEYINPPFILSTEIINEETVTYFGHHLPNKELKKIFKGQQLPSKNGNGLVQPFLFNLQNTFIIFCVTILLVLFTHLFINQDRTGEKVLLTSINFQEFKDKDYVSPSFTLNGSSAPLKIDLSTGVSNSWAWAGVSLINETTNEEIFAEKDLEEYSGVEGGESWSEGSGQADFYICGLGPGKYHLSIKTSKQETDLTNENIHVSAEWNNASNWNIGVIIILLIALFILLFLIKNYFEQTRWADSRYSPYSQE